MDRSEWVLVPRKLTPEMEDAADMRDDRQAIWDAQLAAAPPPPAEQASREDVRPVVDELPPHIRSAAGFLAERLNHAPCDSQAVSDCVRCNALVLARHLMGITVPLRLACQQPTGEEG